MSNADNEWFLALKVMMMPRDTNVYGTIFGGVILSNIDQGGAIGALNEIRKRGWAEQQITTVAMNSVEFHTPVFVGDTVCFFTKLLRIGTTSITMHVTVQTERNGETIKLTEAEVTYVTLKVTDGKRIPSPIRGK